MTFALARSLLLSDAVAPEDLARALLSAATRGTSLVRALLATETVDAARLEQALARGEAPYMRHVSPVPALVARLPPGLCERLLAVPVRRDGRTGTVDVAVVDARDPHAVEEIGHWLRAPVRTVRTSLASMAAALQRISDPERGMRPLAPPMGSPGTGAPHSPVTTPPHGTPKVDSVTPGPDIPIPLNRRAASVEQPIMPMVEPPSPAADREDRAEPVLDLKRRKSSPPPYDSSFASGGPSTVRGPFPSAPPRPALADVASVIAQMQRATGRDTVLDLLVEGVRTVARRVVVFAVRRDGLVGWTCSPEFGERAAIRAVNISSTERTILSEALKQEGVVLAYLPRDAAHAPLVAAVSAPIPGEVAIVAVPVEGRPAAVLLADQLSEALTATERMQHLARVAGGALGRLLRERRK